MNGQGARLEDLAQVLAARAGLPGPLRLEPLPGGRNNRAFALRGGPERDAFLKAYFRHPGDPRDRLASEFAFLRHAWSLGLRCVAEPLARDDEAGLGLFSFLGGARLAAGEITAAHVDMAARFYQGINPPDQPPPMLPDGSEACFSLSAHLSCVERRVDRLAAAARPGQGMRGDAAAFVAGELVLAWQSLLERVRSGASALGLNMDEVLAPELRRVSPSDFGFHNALRAPNGELYFLDFEYAGMDDPAKMVCDFFCQPDLPAPRSELPAFLERTRETSPDDATLSARVDLLLPVYRMKWCCIMLNDFLPVSAARRDYAEGGEAEARRDRQLARTRDALQNLR